MKHSKSNRNRFHTNLSLQMMLLWSPSLALVVPMFAGTHNIIHPPPFRWNAMDDNTGGCSRISSSTSSSRISSSTSSSSSSSTTSSTPNRVLGFHLHMIPSSSNEEHGRQSRDSSFQRPRSKTSILNKRLDTMTPTTNPKILLQVLDDTNVRVETSHLTHDSKRTRRDDTVQFSSHAATTNLYHNSHVPLWFPYIPTRSQIESLKVIELKDACQERGLSKMGKKEELRKRLLHWTNEQHTRRVMERNAFHGNPYQSSLNQYNDDDTTLDTMDPSSSSQNSKPPTSSINLGTMSTSSDDVGSTDNIEPLINRRKALLRSKLFSFSKSKKDLKPSVSGDFEEEDDDDDDEEEESTMLLNVSSTQDIRSNLQKTFDQKTLESTPNNYQLKTLYLQAKHADQLGNISLAKKHLNKLHQVTPRDTRVIRRLARLEMEDGNIHVAREILQSGLRLMPYHSDLLHGLAQLELKCDNIDNARSLYKKALKSNPKFPNPYHALATLEHSQGNIRAATTVLRAGLAQCPSNHRLHHALGDLYREAKMLDMADKEYRKGIKCLESEEESTGKDLSWSKSFFYTGLSYISYEVGNKYECKQWLRKSVEGNNVMHSQGWLGLAQLEESEGNIQAARAVYKEALQRYESKRGLSNSSPKAVFPKRPKLGDKWRQVYSSWARMEEEHDDSNLTNSIYSRGAQAFPKDWQILLNWARFQRRHGEIDRARTLFELACDVSGSNEAKPYVSYADFEISLGCFKRAQSILFLGAQSLAESSSGSLQNEELAKLYHSWAICEWHLGDLDRTEILFDHALRVTDAGPKGTPLRSLIMYSLARFLHHARKEYSLAQHCVCLSLSENSAPGGNAGIWLLWSSIAKSMGNKDLQNQCLVQADRLDKDAHDGLPRLSGDMLRRAPWQYKMLRPKNDLESWYMEITFPQ